MARRINAGENVGRQDVFLVDPREVTVDPALRARWEVDPPGPEAVQELVESFLEFGQSNACVARQNPVDKTLIIEQGQTRHAAALWIVNNRDPKWRLKVTVVDRNEEEGFVCAIEENRVRNETTAMDDAHNMRRLRDAYGWDDARICKTFRCQTQYLRTLETLLSLPVKVQRLVHHHKLAVANAVLMANLAGRDLDDALREVENATSANGRINGSAVRKAVRTRTEAAPNGKKVARTLKDIRGTFTSLQADDQPDSVRKFADLFLKFVKGDITDKTFQKRTVELIGG